MPGIEARMTSVEARLSWPCVVVLMPLVLLDCLVLALAARW